MTSSRQILNGRTPLVSVVVPHYRDLAALEICLGLLEAQTYPSEAFEIIVADNGTPEQAELAALVRDRARLVLVPERGAGPARNGGVAVATGEILAFTDSDCQPGPEWLEEGVAALADYDFVGGKVTVVVDNLDAMTAAQAFERVFAFDFRTYILRKGFTGAGNMFCPRAVFDSVGGFRAGVSEDVDWSRRARDAGFRLGYAPDAVVGHPARRSWPELVQKWRRVNAEAFELATARPAGRLLWFLKACLLPASAIAHSPRVIFSNQLRRAEQRLAALGVLYRLRFWRLAHALSLLAGEAERG